MYRIKDPSKRALKNDASCKTDISHVRVTLDVAQSGEKEKKEKQCSKGKNKYHQSEGGGGQCVESARAAKSSLSGARQPSMMKNGLRVSEQGRLTGGKKESASRTKGSQTRAPLTGGDLQPTAKINLTAHSGGPYFTNPTTPFGRSTSEWEEDAFLRGKRESAQNNRVVNKDGYVPPPITRKKDAATSPEPNLSTLHDVKYSPSTMARPDG